MADGGGGRGRAHTNQLRGESTVDQIKNRPSKIDRAVADAETGVKSDVPTVKDTSKSFFGSPMDEVKKFFGVKKDAE